MDDERWADALYAQIGQNVRRFREREGMTQEELAAEVGVGRTSITNLEQGEQRVALHRILRIAHLLDVDLTALVPSWSDLADELADRQLEDRPETKKWVDQVMNEER